MGQQHATTLGDLVRDAGAFTPEEAVALTLALAERLGWSEPPQQLDSIVVRGDGTVHLPRPVHATPALPADYADRLHRLLAYGRGDARTNVPGALLLLIARARGDIDLPAFASADEFRHALLRFLPRPAPQVIAAVVARVREAPTMAAGAAGRSERRLAGPRVDELRRLLRDADLERIALAERVRQHEADRTRAVGGRDASPPAPASPVTGGSSVRRRRRVSAVSLLGLAVLAGLVWAGRETALMRAPGAASVTGTSLAASPAGRSDTTVDVVTPWESGATSTDGRGGARDAGTDRDAGPQPSRTSAGATSPGSTTGPPRSARAGDTSPAAMPARRAPDVASPGGPGPRQRLQTLNVSALPTYSPSFSPDGTSVYFHAGDGGASRLMRADTSLGGDVLEVATIVDDGARNFHVRLSPDGSRVAFDSDRDGVRGVYVARRDGTGVRRVSGRGYAAVPVWSPDGRELLYVRAEPGAPRTWNLWRVSFGDGREQRVTSHRYGQAWPGSWFSDGQRIAYTHEDRLHVLDIRTGASRSIASPVKGRLVRTAAASPDGRYVAFQVSRDGMWLLDLRDGSIRRVLEDPTAEEFSWSPDGRRIAFHSRRQGRWSVWLMASPS